MDRTRRSFLTGLACAGATAAAGAVPAVASDKREAPSDAVGMLYDTTRCIGCKACVVACHEANDLPPDDRGNGLHDAPQALNDRTKNIIKLYKEEGRRSYMKQQCMHCIDPACVGACMIGIIKCELCNHRLAEGKIPACCEVCPREAVIYGKYDELLTEAHKRLDDSPGRYVDKIYGEFDGGGTQVLYLSHVPFDKLGLPELGSEPVPKLNRTIQHGVYKGMIAPAALYVVLGAVMLRNRKSGSKVNHE